MVIPEKYRQYIKEIRGNPYMMVDGRVAMALDEHREAKKRINVTFETAWARVAKELSGAMREGEASAEALKLIPKELNDLLTATVTSEIYGQFEGTAKIGWDGKGVDSTNPYENAQTSALGRALGFMGYGLLGGGIASAEEVGKAQAEQERNASRGTPAPRPKPVPLVTSSVAGITPEILLPPDSSVAQNETLPNSDEPAKTQTEGPCIDCGKPFDGKQGKAVLTFITNRRKAGDTGDTIRYSHKAVPGGKCPE